MDSAKDEITERFEIKPC